MIDATALPELTSCDIEAIEAPGLIQPHGIMLVAARDGLSVRHVAGDVEQRLGVADWLDQGLDVLIGDALCAKVAALLRRGTATGFIGQLRTAAGETLDVTAHVAGEHVIVELEAASDENLSVSTVMDRLAAASSGFEQAGSLTALCEQAAVGFRFFTGFDRILIYRFLDDDSGKVLAEDRRADLHSFLNHHFPASDVPCQARALYVRNLARVIPDCRYHPAMLRPAWILPVALDMSDTSLRSVSPLHLLYLRNMGVTASASFSIVKDGTLWGLVACHNETPRSLSYDVRAACNALAGGLARQIKARDEAEGLRARIRLRSFEDDIVSLLSREGALNEALSNHLGEIGRMMTGDGIAVLRGRELATAGVCPADGDIRTLAAWLLARAIEPVFSTDRLSVLYPPAAHYEHLGSGVMAVTLSADEPWILLWFRVEQVETVNWAGNPHKDPGIHPLTPLTPRASFEAWREIVVGRARPWSRPEIDAGIRLRLALLDAQQNRRLVELNRQLTKLLQDKDLLLLQKEFLVNEVNHRIQNSLQLVSSYLALQSRASANPVLHTALEEARRRLTAVALVHQRLYRGDQIEVVDAARYIEELCADTFSFMGQDWTQHLTLSLAPILVSTDQAVTLGLVLTELLINSNKYAYGGAAGPIQVGLIELPNQLRLSVADKGVGRTSGRKGFGSRIMEGLVAQLGGTLDYDDNRPGLRAMVSVPITVPRILG